jgi:hypothetical protein|tara:strand:- start:526 stop:1554 length:1029 start_codon:yes stop_codon:yes gene_type:complete
MAEQITTPETGSETPLDATAAIEAMLYPSESNDKPEEKQAEVADEPDDTLSEDDIEEVESETEEEVVLEDDTEESNDVEDDTEDETTELEEEQTFTIKAAGEEKEVTIDELVKSYQMESDYTKKTQSLAEDRKKVEAYGDVIKMAEHTRNEYANRLQALEQVLQNNAESPENLAELKENDPIGYAVKVAEQTQRKDQLQKVNAERQRVMTEQQSVNAQNLHQYVEQEQQKLAQILPEFSDRNKSEQTRNEIRNYGISIGFTETELEQVYDSRHVLTLHKAMQYDKLVKAKPSVNKKVANAPKMIKASAKTKQAAKSITQKQMQKLQQTGSARDAAAIFENLM